MDAAALAAAAGLAEQYLKATDPADRELFAAVGQRVLELQARMFGEG